MRTDLCVTEAAPGHVIDLLILKPRTSNPERRPLALPPSIFNMGSGSIFNMGYGSTMFRICFWRTIFNTGSGRTDLFVTEAAPDHVIDLLVERLAPDVLQHPVWGVKVRLRLEPSQGFTRAHRS